MLNWSSRQPEDEQLAVTLCCRLDDPVKDPPTKIFEAAGKTFPWFHTASLPMIAEKGREASVSSNPIETPA